jgi:transposase InsO family protein
MTHVRASPYYPQSNGKVESWHKTAKRECIRPLTSLNLADARRIVAGFVHEYNTLRLHSGIGYVTPQARLEGRDQQILIERHRKLAVARQARELAHQPLFQLPSGLQMPVLAVA